MKNNKTMEPRWIKLIKTNKVGIPAFAHPDGGQIQLFGAFHVRWPDGSVTQADVRVTKVYTRLKDESLEHGDYVYFEVPFNGMTVIYNLHEVELRADEVEQCRLVKRGKAA